MLAALLLLGGCRSKGEDLPDELLRALRPLTGPMRLTWYLSPELAPESSLREADELLASLHGAVRDVEITSVVRSPLPGERKPLSLLPLPATDGRGGTLILWSALVLDWRDHRVVIPDVLDSSWLAVDLSRAFYDLAAGSPLSAGFLDGSEDSGGLPVGLLSGRWSVSEWDPFISSPDRFDVLIIRDGPGLNSFGAALPDLLEQFVRQGKGILMAPSGTSADSDPTRSPAGVWASAYTGIGGTGEVLYVDDPLFLDSSAYQEGSRHFRELDTAMLLASGRGGLLALIAPEGGFPATDSRTQGPGRPVAGSRLLRKAGRFPRGGAPDASKVTEILFRPRIPVGSGDITTGTEASFSLERADGIWELTSGDWRLPARTDRIEGFLSRLAAGSREIWFPGALASAADSVSSGGPEIVLKSGRRRTFMLVPGSTRSAGGGEFVSTADGTALWPLISAGEMDGDPRYWMDRRLFPDEERIIRAELRTDSRLYWRLHRQGEAWIFTSDRSGIRIPDSRTAEDFIGRLGLMESSTIAPSAVGESPVLSLMVEMETGRRTEYGLSDLPGGMTSATSGEGLQHVLSRAQVEILLQGPVSLP